MTEIRGQIVLTHTQAADFITQMQRVEMRVLPQILSGDGGLRFQWANGFVLDWLPLGCELRDDVTTRPVPVWSLGMGDGWS